MVREAWSSPASGPKALLYRVYKNCPQVPCELMRTRWKKNTVEAEWQQGTTDHKVSNFFTVLAKHMMWEQIQTLLPLCGHLPRGFTLSQAPPTLSPWTLWPWVPLLTATSENGCGEQKGPVGKWCRPARGVARVDPATLILTLDWLLACSSLPSLGTFLCTCNQLCFTTSDKEKQTKTYCNIMHYQVLSKYCY